MAVHRETRLVPYAADLLYAVVADVERYPDFLPGCQGLKLLSRETVGEEEILRAEMTAGSGPLRLSYISRVVLSPVARRIAVTQLSGPFRQLDTLWHFTPQAGGTVVDFSITFEFRNPLFEAAMGAVFAQSVRKISHAFEMRAASLINA
ncbi:MAG: type II toxin-antitoxin system RatA family toxin [Rhizomicrobium sp.]